MARLLLGIHYQGKTYFEFSPQLLTLGAECQALELIEELAIPLDSKKKADDMLIQMAYLSQQIQIDGLAQDVLTPRFLLDNLAADDYLIILDELEKLRKKRIAAGGNPTSEPIKAA